jgi:hypothetical protein
MIKLKILAYPSFISPYVGPNTHRLMHMPLSVSGKEVAGEKGAAGG